MEKDLVFNVDGTERIHMPVALSAEFIRALFNMEVRYDEGETYTITEGGQVRKRKLHHLTNADVVTAITLHVACNTMGEIRETNPHNLYEERLCKLFEEPITYPEFRNSLKKLELNHLISVSINEYTKRQRILLHHFIQDETGKPERYIIAHPVVFRAAFTRLTISHIKLYLVLIWQQGDRKQFVFSRELETTKAKDIIMGGLKTLLHKQQSSDVKRVVSELVSMPFLPDGETLCCKSEKKPLLEKRGKRYFQINVCLNPLFHVKVKKGMHYRFPLQPKETYRRESAFLKEELEKKKIGELTSVYNGTLFRDVLYTLKDRSKTAIRHAVDTVKEYVDDKGKFPSEIQQFILDRIRYRTMVDYIRIAKEEGIYDYLLQDIHDPHEKERKRFSFVSTFSYYSLRVFRRMCRLSKPVLEKYHSRQAFSEETYASLYVPALHHIRGIDVVRSMAIRNRLHPEAYAEVEAQAARSLKASDNLQDVCTGMIKALKDLEPVSSAPALTPDFDLEAFMVSEYKHYTDKIKKESKPFYLRTV